MLWLVAHYLWLSNLHHGSCSVNCYRSANCLGRKSPDKIFLYARRLPSAELCYTIFSIMLWLNPLATWEYTGKLLMSLNSSVTHRANPARSDNSVCMGRRAPAASVSHHHLAVLQVSQKLPAASVCLSRTARIAFSFVLTSFLSARSVKKACLSIWVSSLGKINRGRLV